MVLYDRITREMYQNDTGRVYGALPTHHEEEPSCPPTATRAPGQPPNWQPKRASPSTRIYGPPPQRTYTNRSSAESDADVLDLRAKRRRVDDDDDWGERVRCDETHYY